jgi:hypothetical protein
MRISSYSRQIAEYGALGACRFIRADLHRNLFSKTRELDLLYELTYPGRVEWEYAKLNDAVRLW